MTTNEMRALSAEIMELQSLVHARQMAALDKMLGGVRKTAQELRRIGWHQLARAVHDQGDDLFDEDVEALGVLLPTLTAADLDARTASRLLQALRREGVVGEQAGRVLRNVLVVMEARGQ